MATGQIAITFMQYIKKMMYRSVVLSLITMLFIFYENISVFKSVLIDEF